MSGGKTAEEFISQTGFQKKRLIVNAVSSSLSWLIPLILAFVATPIIVKGLGNEEYGLYSLILGFISYSFAFGIGRAVTKYVSEFRADGRESEIKEIISITLWFSVILGVAGNIVILLTAKKIVADVLQIGAEQQEKAVNALYLACVTITFSMIAQVFQSVIQAIHRFDRLAILSNVSGLILVTGSIVIVKLEYGLLALIGWNLLVMVLNCLTFFLTVKKLFPDFRLTFSITGKNARLIFLYGLGITGYQIFANALLIFERSWITRKLGSESLTFYVVPMTLAMYYQGFMNNILLVIFPIFSELRNNSEQLTKLYQKATKFVLALSVFAVVTALCGSKLILSLWIDDQFAAQTYQLMSIHFVSFSLLVIFTVIWQIAEGFGYPKFNVILTLIWGLVAVPLMFVSVNEWGNTGVAISRMTGIIVTIPFILIGEKIFLKRIYWSFWGKILLILAIAATPVVLVEEFIFNYFAVNWATLIAGVIIGALIYAVFLLLFRFITAEEKLMFREMILRKQT